MSPLQPGLLYLTTCFKRCFLSSFLFFPLEERVLLKPSEETSPAELFHITGSVWVKTAWKGEFLMTRWVKLYHHWWRPGNCFPNALIKDNKLLHGGPFIRQHYWLLNSVINEGKHQNPSVYMGDLFIPSGEYVSFQSIFKTTSWFSLKACKPLTLGKIVFLQEENQVNCL
jgi:hypothetical protein